MSARTNQTFKSWLEQADTILLSTHLLPDGDGLGAEIALFHYLKQTQKTCKIFNPDSLPKRYQLLDPENLLLLGPEKDAPRESWNIWDQFDLWVIVDTNDPRRLGKLWDILSPRAKKIVFLDHHIVMTDVPEVIYPSHALVVSDTASSSIGELLYTLFTELGELGLGPLNQKVALGLYVSVMTDTNSFRYARTTPLAHRIAAEMIELGVNPEEVYQAIYSSKEVSHIQLMGRLLQNVQVSPSGKVAWLQMDMKLRKKYGASADDTLSFLNLLLLIKDSEVICFFREEEDHQIRVSMKSKGRVVIHELAIELGGGGHEFAAGAAFRLPLDQAVSMVITKLDALVLNSSKDLPPLFLDPRLIRNVYLNLITNSLKYSPIESTIEINISRNNDELISRITDHGCGIPENEKSKVFEKFFRASNARKVETGGTGLGLYLSKAIVEYSGGRIWFESDEHGTSFWFTIPLSGIETKKDESVVGY